ncbi:MAG: Maf-like protein [Hyphomicrobiales bacterium]|nr:MAG: Maf-like protein [Hyphomicrobiales bacterium]
MSDETPCIILASQSPARTALMTNAGLEFAAIPADIDERAVEAPLLEAGFAPEDIAAVLAEAKALEISKANPGAFVIGADQILAMDGKRWTKPDDMEAARRQLLDLSGRTHTLHAAVAGVVDGETVWRHASAAHMTMRSLTPEFIGHYLAAVGPHALDSVGAYQLEGRGVQLFDKIDGDFFTILGLPMLPLLAELRARGLVE